MSNWFPENVPTLGGDVDAIFWFYLLHHCRVVFSHGRADRLFYHSLSTQDGPARPLCLGRQSKPTFVGFCSRRHSVVSS